MLTLVRAFLPLIFLAGYILAYGTVALAQDRDPHRIYEEKCAGCHVSHAGDFAHDSLVITDGNVLGRRSSVNLRTFLERGHGKLTPQEIDVIITHLKSILTSGRLFQRKCVICHDPAVKLARSELIIKDGRLTGRYTGRDMAEFLTVHGRLETDEVGKMLDVLERQLIN